MVHPANAYVALWRQDNRAMNSKHRILTAMNHKEPDRVPVMCQLALGHYFLNCSFSPREIWFDSEIFAKALVDLQKRYEFDGILVNIPGRPQDWTTNIRSSQRINNVGKRSPGFE